MSGLDIANEHTIWYVYGTQEILFILCRFATSEVVIVEFVATGSNYHCATDTETAAGFRPVCGFDHTFRIWLVVIGLGAVVGAVCCKSARNELGLVILGQRSFITLDPESLCSSGDNSVSMTVRVLVHSYTVTGLRAFEHFSAILYHFFVRVYYFNHGVLLICTAHIFLRWRLPIPYPLCPGRCSMRFHSCSTTTYGFSKPL